MKLVGAFILGVVWVCGAFGATGPSAASGSEPGIFQVLHHLEDRPMSLVEIRKDAPTISGEPITEKYLLKDQWGNNCLVEVGQTGMIARYVAAAALAAVLGVPHLPAYPILAHRGRNGIPTREQVVASGATPSDYFHGDNWSPGVLIPDNPHQKAGDPAEFNAQQAGEHFLLHLTAFLLRSAGPEIGKGEDGRLFIANFPEIYLRRQVSPKDFFRDTFKSFYREKLKHFTEDQQRFFIERQLLPFLDRAEHLQGQPLKEIWYPAAASKAEVEQWPIAVFTTIFELQLKEVRSLAENYLRTRVGGVFSKVSLAKTSAPARVPLWFGFSTLSDFRAETAPIANPVYRRKNAKKLLLAFHMATTMQQMALTAQWTKALGVDPIEALLADATHWDATVAVFGPSKTTGHFVGDGVSNQQFSLNRQAKKTLVVLSDSDLESQAIAEIVEQIGPTVSALPYVIESTDRVQFVTDQHVTEIIAYAQHRGIKRIVLCEMGGFTQGQYRRLQVLGFEVVELDHHNRGAHNWQKWSTIEQFCELYNYIPDLRQLTIGMIDRGGISALAQLGFDKNDLESFLPMGTMRGYREVVAQYDNQAPVTDIPFYESKGSMGKFTNAFGAVHFPYVRNKLVVQGRDLKFNGDPELAWKILDHFHALSAKVSGGDNSVSMYVQLPLRRPEDLWHFVDVINRLANGENLKPFVPGCPRAVTEAPPPPVVKHKTHPASSPASMP
ncbi:hypothetical protein K2X33_09465 [bacterium]|nr:hypothetical protein [bacterium]